MASMWRVTHQVNLPTVALGLLWIVHSAATTLYVPWQNGRQRAALESVVSNVGLTLQLHDQLTELRGLASSSNSVESKSSLKQSILNSLSRLKPLLNDPYTQPQLTALQDHLLEQLQHEPLEHSAMTTLLEECQQLIQTQQQQFLTIVDQRSRTDIVVMIVRAVLLALGLMVGIGLAMWIARGLRQSLSEISVTLKGVEGDLQMDLGRIEIVSQNSAGELKLLESQVQQIVQNVHRVAEELHQTRQDMARAERLAAVGELAAGVAHEIRNPLTSVKLLVQRAAERQPVHSFNEDQLQVLLEEISRMETTVQGLLDFARPDKAQRYPCDLIEILERTLMLLEGRIQQQQIQVIREFQNSSQQVYGDPRQIQQVLVNLILNALEFMQEGGELIIRLLVELYSNYAVLEIEDTGPGIPVDVQARLFEPFITTRSTGSGLGLAISRRMIEEQGGTLTSRNSPYGGAIFSIKLPLAETGSESSCD